MFVSDNVNRMLQPQLWIFLFITCPTIGLLCFAALTKLYPFSKGATIPIWEVSLSTAEIACALLLLFRRNSPLTQLLLIFLASGFLGSAVVGYASRNVCNCFGPVVVLPLDRLLLASLLFIASIVHLSHSWVLPRTIPFVVLFVVGGAMVELAPHRQVDESSEMAISRLIPQDVTFGTWEVTIVRAGCPACRSHLSQYNFSPMLKEYDIKKALLVLGPTKPWIDRFADRFELSASIPEPRDATISTPQILLFHDGQLVKGELNVH